LNIIRGTAAGIWNRLTNEKVETQIAKRLGLYSSTSAL
jgi:hypothetical protein